MKRLHKLLLAVAFGAGTLGAAQASEYSVPVVRSVEARSGAPVLIGVYIDCQTHAPFESTAFVQHGRVTTKHVTVDDCGRSDEPAIAYYYVSNPGFKGLDEVNLPLAQGTALIVHVTVR